MSSKILFGLDGIIYEDLETFNVHNLVRFYQAELRIMHRTGHVGESIPKAVRYRFRYRGIIKYQDKTWSLTELGQKLLDQVATSET
jgi:hypothetical protein